MLNEMTEDGRFCGRFTPTGMWRGYAKKVALTQSRGTVVVQFLRTCAGAQPREILIGPLVPLPDAG